MLERDGQANGITRREALRNAGAAGLGLAALGAGIEGLLAEVAAGAPRTGSLRDIEHVIIFIQENRSFDHYFGTLSGVRGFGDKAGRKLFTQENEAGQKFHPFRLSRECYPDLTHNWGPQHMAWNHGKMDKFVIAHEITDKNNGVETMGYYERADVPLYYALADAFTICDGYHCSVIGPTDPNRLMSMSATIDPAGTHGGPLIQTNILHRTPHFSWKTMPESLQAKGISWKVYTAGAGGVLDNILTYFDQYSAGSALADRGLSPVYPDDLMADISSGKLPQVSWVLANLQESEHPLYSESVNGQIATHEVVTALMSNPAVWKKSALFITWDENGGFFDHVPPPVAPRGTPGEYLASPLPNDPSFHGQAQGFAGPIGLGFRVPMLVVSPFSRGGLVCSDTFDHTSMLRFVETRFGARVPNLSAWRRRTTGDMTSAFNFAAKPVTSKPRLPNVASAIAGCAAPDNATPVAYAHQPFPKQEPGTRRRPSGLK